MSTSGASGIPPRRARRSADQRSRSGGTRSAHQLANQPRLADAAFPPRTSVTGAPPSARWSACSMAVNSVSRSTRTGLRMLLPTAQSETRTALVIAIERPGAFETRRAGGRAEPTGPAAGGGEADSTDERARGPGARARCEWIVVPFDFPAADPAVDVMALLRLSRRGAHRASG